MLMSINFTLSCGLGSNHTMGVPCLSFIGMSLGELVNENSAV